MDKNKILIRKDIFKDRRLSDEAIAVYCALCKYHKLYFNGRNFTSYLSIEYLEYLLFGKTKHRGTDKILKKALDDLADLKFVYPIDVFNDGSGVYDMTPILSFDRKKYYVDITIDELNAIMKIKYVKFGLLRYFLTLICSFKTACSINKKYRFKVSTTSIETLAKTARIASTTAIKYNSILVKNKIIYISRSYGAKKINNSSKDLAIQISNVYSRYEDEKICNDYAKEISVSCKKEPRKVHSEVNTSRKYIQMYNQMLKGREYDLETVQEIYSHVEHWNYKKRAEYMEKYGSDVGLEENLKNLEVFKKYGLN